MMEIINKLSFQEWHMSFIYLILQIYGKINKDGVFLEQLETNPAKYLPDVSSEQLGGDVVKVMWIDVSLGSVYLL